MPSAPFLYWSQFSRKKSFRLIKTFVRRSAKLTEHGGLIQSPPPPSPPLTLLLSSLSSSSDIDAIQSSLSQHLDNPSNWFRVDELIFNLKKGKSEVLLFVTGKRLDLFQDCQVKLSVSGSLINTSTCYKYMYLGVHLDPTSIC